MGRVNKETAMCEKVDSLATLIGYGCDKGMLKTELLQEGIPDTQADNMLRAANWFAHTPAKD